MLRSRVVRIHKVPQWMRLGPALAAAVLGERFELPAGILPPILRGLPFLQSYVSRAASC